MKKNNLVTTSLSYTRSKSLKNIYLGEWCFNYNDPERINTNKTILNYHSSDIDKRIKDEEFTNKIYENLLENIYKILNEYHKTDYSIDFWRILINPFLIAIVNIIFDKWESVRIAKLKYDNLITKEIFIPEDHLIACLGFEQRNLSKIVVSD